MADSLRSARNAENTKNPRAKAQQHSRWGNRIIRSFVRDGRQYQLHATKGWRDFRA